MLERHKKRLDEIANRSSKLKRQAAASPLAEYSGYNKINENKRTIHEILL